VRIGVAGKKGASGGGIRFSSQSTLHKHLRWDKPGSVKSSVSFQIDGSRVQMKAGS
jgi:hypothetical protein